ncbi:hypothetical protein GCM10009801_06470 [Streptomyces albiaxialis]|uniref:PLAT domain-containing protein n=1 Tax=Streptomyces albiaxialis TaxID=329523 RepID=A0ABP5H4N1_9ACTN
MGEGDSSVGLPCAEVEEVWPRDGRITLRLTLVGTAAGAATLLLRTRGEAGRREELRVAAEGSGREFTATVPLERLVMGTGTGTGADGSWVWDLYLVPEGGAGLRLGRHLDDVQGKKHIFRYPVQYARGTAVEPYFTVNDNLSLACRGEDGVKAP